MIAAILNSSILDSAILHKKTSLIHSDSFDDGSHLEFSHLGFRHLVIFSQIHSKTLSLHSDSDSNKFSLTQTHSFSLNLMMAAILNFAILNFSILDSDILHKKLHSFILTHLMMAAILNSPILDSDTLLSSLRFTPKHSHSTLTLTQTNSVWLKLIHSPLTWWWQPSWILPSWIQTMLSWIQKPCYLLLVSLKNTLTPLCLWLKLIQSDELDDGSHLELCHLGFSHLSISSQTHTCQDWFPPFAQKKLHSHFLSYHLHKKTSLIYSDLTWWWQPSWILPSWIWPSWIQLS